MPYEEIGATAAEGFIALLDLDVPGALLHPAVGSLTFLWVVDPDGRIRICVETLVAEVGDIRIPRLRGVSAPPGWLPIGHPVLVALGAARIGGELYADVIEGRRTWVLNNKSGRYGAGQTRTLDQLMEVGRIFDSLGVQVYLQFRT